MKTIHYIMMFMFFVCYLWAQDNEATKIIKKARTMTDWLKEGYDKKQAQELLDSVIYNEKYDLYDRLSACFQNGNIYHVNSSSADENLEIAKKYYELYLKLLQGRYATDLPQVKFYLVSIEDKDVTKRRVAVYLWAMEAMLSTLISDQVVLPPSAKTNEEKRKAHLNLAHDFFGSQNTFRVNLANLLDSTREIKTKNLVKELGLDLSDPSTGNESRKAFVTEEINKLYGYKEPIVKQSNAVRKVSSYELSQQLISLSQKPLSKEDLNAIAEYLSNNEKVVVFEQSSDKWQNLLTVADFAAEALERSLYGENGTWFTFKYRLAGRAARLKYWKAWWQENGNRSLEEIGRLIIEMAIEKPITEQDLGLESTRNYRLGSTLSRWLGSDFYFFERVFFLNEDSNKICREIETWWKSVKDQSMLKWKLSASEFKEKEEYKQFQKEILAAREVLEKEYQALRKRINERMIKEFPEDLKVFAYVYDEAATKEQIQDALQRIGRLKQAFVNEPLFDSVIKRIEYTLKNSPVLIEAEIQEGK